MRFPKLFLCFTLAVCLLVSRTVAQAPRSAKEASEIDIIPLEKPDSNGIYTYVAQMTEFYVAKWGNVSVYLSKHLSIPTNALEEGPVGSVVVAFVINEKGTIVAPRIVRSSGKSVDSAVLKLMHNMPR